ncbi:MAG: hypothetical protein ACM3VT_18670 [Solirubrobacterales bacterium]
MMMNPMMIPMTIVPLAFLFVLLIILINKSPKAGAWVVGGLLLLTPLVLLRLAAGGAFTHAEAIPLFVVPMAFLFVLLIILVSKAPKIGVGLIVAFICVVVMGLLVSVFHLSPVRRETTISMQSWQPVEPGNTPAATLVVTQSLGGPPSPIWSEGVEQELEADVYPSSRAAADALGRRMVELIRTVAGDPNAEVKVILFQEGNDRSLLTAFGRAMEKELPQARCSIEADLRNINPDEVGLTLRLDTAHQDVVMAEGAAVRVFDPQANTRIVATAFRDDRRASAEADFIDKTWVENFSAFAGARPNETYIVARSNGTCTSEIEANQQALDDARARLTESLGRRQGRPFADWGRTPVSTTDVLNGGFVADRFVQSFDGSAGKIWRQAMLIDVSGPKLSTLAQQKAGEVREARMTWARMALSVVGVLLLIGVIYFFLNMATRGYYEWSLRIAGVVLAVVAIVSILMIVH